MTFRLIFFIQLLFGSSASTSPCTSRKHTSSDQSFFSLDTSARTHYNHKAILAAQPLQLGEGPLRTGSHHFPSAAFGNRHPDADTPARPDADGNGRVRASRPFPAHPVRAVQAPKD